MQIKKRELNPPLFDQLQIREKINRANRLYEVQLLATKSGEVTPYKRSVFEERIRETQKEVKLKDSKN